MNFKYKSAEQQMPKLKSKKFSVRLDSGGIKSSCKGIYNTDDKLQPSANLHLIRDGAGNGNKIKKGT